MWGNEQRAYHTAEKKKRWADAWKWYEEREMYGCRDRQTDRQTDKKEKAIIKAKLLLISFESS